MATDYTSRDFEALKRDMINMLVIKVPELTNKSDSEFAVAMIELFAYVGDLLSYTLDRYSNEVYLPTAIQKENVAKICSMLGYKLYNYNPSIVELTFSINSPQSKRIIIPAKTVCMTEGISPVKFETDELAIIEPGETSVTVNATQGETKEEVLGYSDGSANQRFELTYTQVLDGIKIYVEGDDYEEIDNFINSTKDSKNFVVEKFGDKKVRIIFGNGVNGYIPEENYEISTSYRIGGGIIGNVSMSSINTIKGQIYDEDNNIVELFVNNEEDASGGLDEEPIASAKIKAPAQIYTLWRAVTREDFIKLATTLPDVQQAVATLETILGSTRVNLYIKLLNIDNIPEIRLEQLYEFFLERKLIGATVLIHPPVYKQATINISAVTFPNYFNSEIRQKIIDNVNADYAPGKLGFGQEMLDGVVVQSLMAWKEIKNADVQITNGSALVNEIVRIGNLNVTVTGGK